MRDKNQWTNGSVRAFAGESDPVGVMEEKARELVLNAMDDGWVGPPYDLMSLARWRGIDVKANGDIADARIIPKSSDEGFVLEYNPGRPRGRLRFSIAHEIAHTLFADCADKIRHRNASAVEADDWQLELLCNIGAAEILMPLGTFADLAVSDVGVDLALELRKRFDTSVEACLLRIVKLTDQPCAVFCASRHADGSYRIDYLVPSLSADIRLEAGFIIPADSQLLDVNAIGYTAKMQEQWGDDELRIECVGLAPYLGSVNPRVVGILKSRPRMDHKPELKEIRGDALQPSGRGAKLIAHVVPNINAPWGGGGFASAVRRRLPAAFDDFKQQISANQGDLPLGEVITSRLSDDLYVVHMVAQRGIGDRGSHRLRLAALSTCLSKLNTIAHEKQASVHMPRIGTGHGGADWNIVRQMVMAEISDKGVPATVYTLPE